MIFEIDLLSYALWIGIKAVLIIIALTTVICIIYVQVNAAIKRKSKFHRHLTWRDFSGLDVKRYMLSSKLWHIQELMDEYGYRYSAHNRTSGLVSYVYGPCCVRIYLKTLKWRCSLQRSVSIKGQLENLNDLRDVMELIEKEINLYEEKGRKE